MIVSTYGNTLPDLTGQLGTWNREEEVKPGSREKANQGESVIIMKAEKAMTQLYPNVGLVYHVQCTWLVSGPYLSC